jgi:acyl-CoA synthetase (AMP-forming)/AMP-acid ligase II
VAIVSEGGGEATYAELAAAAEAVHARLAAEGVEPGDRVAVHLPNGPG